MEMVEVGIASKRRILGIAVIHHTTLKPTTLELLASWSPSRPWYAEGPGVPAPALTKGGGVRLDDPQGDDSQREVRDRVVVTGTAGAQPTTNLVPLTYRGARSTVPSTSWSAPALPG